jgi:hypothetical protein
VIERDPVLDTLRRLAWASVIAYALAILWRELERDDA